MIAKTETTFPSEELIGRARRSLTRLSRFTNRLQRTQLSCGPVTVQQCHTLEALTEGPMQMNKLADEVALHQSTLTRVVEKLEEKALVTRSRPVDNQRTVEVALTKGGETLYAQIENASTRMIGNMLSLVAAGERAGAVRGLEVLCDLLDPENALVKQIVEGCCCADDLQNLSVAKSEGTP